MIVLLINLLIILLVLGVAWWIVSLFLPRLPEPLPLIIQVVFVLIVLIVVIDLLLGISGGGGAHDAVARIACWSASTISAAARAAFTVARWPRGGL